MQEIWKEADASPLYEVSNTGKVRPKNPRYKNVTELKPVPTRFGYMRVCLERKLILVHRLVAAAFIDNPHNLPEVNHKDEDKSNNSVDNLEWCSRSYNQSYSKSKVRYFISPDNILTKVLNFKKFCRDNNLNVSNLLLVHKGIRPHTKGWRALK